MANEPWPCSVVSILFYNIFAHLVITVGYVYNTGCRDFLRGSLFIVGEIGGNDYGYPFTQGLNLEEVTPNIVPQVISIIGYTIEVGFIIDILLKWHQLAWYLIGFFYHKLNSTTNCWMIMLKKKRGWSSVGQWPFWSQEANLLAAARNIWPWQRAPTRMTMTLKRVAWRKGTSSHITTTAY